jgi:hypothetical protein
MPTNELQNRQAVECEGEKKCTERGPPIPPAFGL